jgi:two-component system NarL family sensor kinase
MKKISFVLLLCIAFLGVKAQQKQIDSLKSEFKRQTIIEKKIELGKKLIAKLNSSKQTDSIVYYYDKLISISKKYSKHSLTTELINDKGLYFDLSEKLDSAIKYYKEAISYGNKYFILKETGQSYTNLGYVFLELNKFNEVFENWESALRIYRKANDANNSSIALNNIGALYNKLNNSSKGLIYLQESLKIADSIQNNRRRSSAYNNLGKLFDDQNNFDLAIKYYALSKEAAIADNNKRQILLCNYNIAGIYLSQKKYVEALEAYLENIERYNAKSDKRVYNHILNSLALCYRKLNDSLNAKKFFKLSLEESEKNNDKEALVVNYINYIGFLKDLYRTDEALIMAFKALEIIENNNPLLLKFKHDVFQSIATLYSIKKNYKLAFTYADSLVTYKDAYLNKENNSKLLELQTKYETQQKESKINLLSKADSIKALQITNQQLAINKSLFELSQQQLVLAEDSILLFTQNETLLQNKLDASLKEEKINTLTKEGLQKQLALQQQQAAIKQKNNTIIIIAIGAILLLVIAYAFYRKKQLQQQAFMVQEQAKQRELITKAVIDAEEAERKRIASDLHDGVGQLFSAVKMNLAGLIDRIDLPKEEDQFLAEKTLALVDESCKEVRVISHKMMPNFLLKSGIASDIRSFIEKIDESTLKIHFETKGFKEQIEFNEEVILYRVIQELIGNVIKHAQANELYLHLEKNDKQIQVQVTDNGLGFNYDNAIAKGGLGLKNILVRIEYLKGTISFTPNQPTGTIVKINIPLA